MKNDKPTKFRCVLPEYTIFELLGLDAKQWMQTDGVSGPYGLLLASLSAYGWSDSIASVGEPGNERDVKVWIYNSDDGGFYGKLTGELQPPVVTLRLILRELIALADADTVSDGLQIHDRILKERDG